MAKKKKYAYLILMCGHDGHEHVMDYIFLNGLDASDYSLELGKDPDYDQFSFKVIARELR